MPYKDPAMARARRRNREHLKRVTVSDITHQQELEMRRKARKCPLCSVWMTSKPHLPNSKELDHILPVCVGGTHTHGNVRIICRKCNQSRPKDGSDAGQFTLWAQGDVPLGRRRQVSNRETCRRKLHPWVPENITVVGGRQRCKACHAAHEAKRTGPRRQCKCGAPFAAKGNTFMCPVCIEAAGHKAAELHAGGMSWRQVAGAVGYTTDEGARYAAERIGYRPVRPERRARREPRCGCGGQLRLGSRYCPACINARALRAVHLRNDLSWPLWRIAGELGLSSISSVTNLLKTVVEVETRMGRPRKTASL